VEEDVYRGRSEFDMVDGECARIRKEHNALRSKVSPEQGGLHLKVGSRQIVEPAQ
jgi:hypothetical protein